MSAEARCDIQWLPLICPIRQHTHHSLGICNDCHIGLAMHISCSGICLSWYQSCLRLRWYCLIAKCLSMWHGRYHLVAQHLRLQLEQLFFGKSIKPTTCLDFTSGVPKCQSCIVVLNASNLSHARFAMLNDLVRCGVVISIH
jgi:hypothetical protein